MTKCGAGGDSNRYFYGRHRKKVLAEAGAPHFVMLSTAKAINYTLNRWEPFTRFLNDGRVCLSNNAAERGLRGAAIGRRNWTFAGSDEGGRRAAAVYTLIETCKFRHPDLAGK